MYIRLQCIPKDLISFWSKHQSDMKAGRRQTFSFQYRTETYSATEQLRQKKGDGTRERSRFILVRRDCTAGEREKCG